MGNNYLVEHTVGSLIFDSFKIYFRHFSTLLFLYVLPSVPAMALHLAALHSGNVALTIATYLLLFIVGYIAYAATAIAVSDICIGNAPSIKRSYEKIRGKVVLRMLWTNIVQAAAILLGLAALVIPGLVLIVWYTVVSPVVVLEGKGVAALRRSKRLGDGFHWRNAGFLVLLLIIYLFFLLVNMVPVIAYTIYNPGFAETLIFKVMTGLPQVFYFPVVFISLILVYYDLRVRKEGYDAKALAEDLAR